jgi:hypothetical protein
MPPTRLPDAIDPQEVTVYRQHLTVGGLGGASAEVNHRISPARATDITGRDHADLH